MADWRSWLIGFAALAVIAPLVAWLGRRFGRQAIGGVMLASVMLGFGEVFDPPAKRPTESTEPVKGRSDNGEPPLP